VKDPLQKKKHGEKERDCIKLKYRLLKMLNTTKSNNRKVVVGPNGGKGTYTGKYDKNNNPIIQREIVIHGFFGACFYLFVFCSIFMHVI
jgi:hypothetical protein